MSELNITYPIGNLPKVVDQVRATFPTGRIFTLTGDLGAGKTTFVSEFCRRIGVADETSSPTFSIVSEYAAPDGPVYHIDCYRLRDIEEALDMGMEDYLDGGAYCFIEWPAVIEPMLPSGVVHLRLEHTAGGTARTLTATTAKHE